MCGIFGVISKNEGVDPGKLFTDLFLLSESRGKEASGFALVKSSTIRVHKSPVPASEMVKGEVYNNELENHSGLFAGIGHSRLVTNGYEQFDANNQPVVKEGFVVIHNGIIVNDTKLWEKYSPKISDLDSELIPTILSDRISKGHNIGQSIRELFSEISGMTNIALFSVRYPNLVLATNNGSIYYINSPCSNLFIFASERHILNELIKKDRLEISNELITQLLPGQFVSLNLQSMAFEVAEFGHNPGNIQIISEARAIVNLTGNITGEKNIYINSSLDHQTGPVKTSFLDTVNERKLKIDQLKRCTKCLLPESFPFIMYDDKGVCNYCNNYNKIDYAGEEELFGVAEKHRRDDGRADCLVPFSGGRDSSFALHYIVKKLKLKPIAYSYDWGMLTDLGRRNQARMCGKLGVEHILVSADIRKKRENIRKNVLAWLRKPDLGTVPLFMAGDKQYFYFANLLMKQNNLQLSILGENMLETTNFKSGFCGIRPHFGKGHTYSLSLSGKLKLMTYYGKQYLTNPGYLNSSLLDTLDAFRSYYLIKHSNLNIFDYLKWDEKAIMDTIINEYEWETDPGTTVTWRIGDGTAAFYNYIYYMLAGFTENDTFRSNQIREGDLTREKAMELVNSENAPRWDSIQWYCRTIGINFEDAIQIINKARFLYE